MTTRLVAAVEPKSHIGLLWLNLCVKHVSSMRKLKDTEVNVLNTTSNK